MVELVRIRLSRFGGVTESGWEAEAGSFSPCQS